MHIFTNPVAKVMLFYFLKEFFPLKNIKTKEKCHSPYFRWRARSTFGRLQC